MSTYHTPAEQPHHPFLGTAFRRATTKLGRRALQSLGLSYTFLVAMIFGEGIGGLVFLVGVVGVIGFLVVGVIAAWVAIIRRGERAPSVFLAALSMPVLMVINTPVATLAGMMLVAAAVLNEILPHRSR